MWQNAARQIKELFPIAAWLPQYGGGELRGDVAAGLTVGVMLIPQGVAYAAIAGMPPVYGLYAAVVPLLVYPLLGTSRQLSIGPIAIDMVIVAAGVGALADPSETWRYVALVVLLAAMNGLLQLAMGTLRLGFLADLLSRPVIDGFTTAAALVIAAGQLANLTGLELPNTQYVHVQVWETVQQLGAVDGVTLALGVAGIALLLVLQWLAPQVPGALVVAIFGVGIVWGMGLAPAGGTATQGGGDGVEIVGALPSGLPAFSVPEVGLSDLRALLPTALTLALVQFMSVVSLGRVFAKRHEYTIEPNSELLAVGAANLAGSFFQGLPVAGSFSRSAVNDRAGARTPLSNVVTAGVIALTLLVLTPLFFYLPLPALAAIIIVAAVGLIDVAELRALFRAKSQDGGVAVFTAITTLLVGLQEGLLLGIGASVVLVLYGMSRPNMVELGHLRGTRSFRDRSRREEAEPLEDLLVLRVDASFSFVNAGTFKEFILERSHEAGRPVRAVVVDGSSVNDLDTTAIDALSSLLKALEEEGVELYLTGLIGPVRETMERSGLRARFGPGHFFRNPHHAVKRILAAWDAEDGGHRREGYDRSTEAEAPAVAPSEP